MGSRVRVEREVGVRFCRIWWALIRGFILCAVGSHGMFFKKSGLSCFIISKDRSDCGMENEVEEETV